MSFDKQAYNYGKRKTEERIARKQEKKAYAGEVVNQQIAMGNITSEEIKEAKTAKFWSGLAIFVSIIVFFSATAPLNLPGVVFGIAAFALSILAMKKTIKPLRTGVNTVAIVFSSIAMLAVVGSFALYIVLNAFTGIYY